MPAIYRAPQEQEGIYIFIYENHFRSNSNTLSGSVGVYRFANGQSTYIQPRPALVYLIVI